MSLFEKVPRRSQAFVRAALIDSAAAGILLGMVQPFAGVLARRMGAGPYLLCLLSIAPFLGFVTSAIVPRLLYRYEWSRLMGMIRIFSRGALISVYFIGSAAPLIAVLVALKVLTGWSKVLFGAMMKSNVYSQARPGVFKWVRSIGLMVSVPSAYLTGYLMDLDPSNYRLIFSAAGFLAMLGAVFFFLVPERPSQTVVRENRCSLFEEFILLKKDRRFLVFMCVFFVGTLAEKLVMPIHPIFFADVLDLKYSEVGLAMGIVGPVLSVAGYLFWGKLLDRTDPVKILTLCMFVKGLRPALWALAGVQGMPVMLLVAGGMGIFRFMISGLELSVLLSVIKRSDNASTPMYMGIHYSFMGLRGLLGPLIGVTMYNAGMNILSIYWVVTSLVILGGVALLFFSRWEKGVLKNRG